MTQPMPPPRVSPPTPVWETCPNGIASACGAAASPTSLRSAPPPTRAVAFAASIEIAFINERSSVSPPSDIEWPGRLWPPQRTAISRPASRALRIAVETSLTVRGRAISAGRRSAIAFHSVRAAPYRGSGGRITSPEKRSSSVGRGRSRVAVVEVILGSFSLQLVSTRIAAADAPYIGDLPHFGPNPSLGRTRGQAVTC